MPVSHQPDKLNTVQGVYWSTGMEIIPGVFTGTFCSPFIISVIMPPFCLAAACDIGFVLK